MRLIAAKKYLLLSIVVALFFRLLNQAQNSFQWMNKECLIDNFTWSIPR